MRRQRRFHADDARELLRRFGKGETQNVARAYTPTTIASATLDLHFAAAIMQPWNGVFIDQFTEQAIPDPRVLAASSTADSATLAIRWSSLMLDFPTFA